MKKRRSRSPDPLEVTSPGRTPAQPSPSAFPELLDSAKRFAVVSPRPKLTSPSRHRPMLGKPASPTIQQLFSRQAASQSPGGAKPSSAPASAPVKSMSGNPAGGAEPAVVCTSVKGHESAAAATAVRERRPHEQRDRLLVNKQATGILSEVVNSSAAGRVAPLRSVISGERGGQQAVSGADAMNQSSTPISPDESSGVQQTSGADEQVMDVTSPARTGGRSDSSPESTGGQGGQSAHGVRVGRNWNRQERKLRKQFSGRQSIAAAEVIELD